MLTAEELKITQEELDALLKTRQLLSSGCVVDEGSTNNSRLRFNMNSTGSYGSACGTVACIGGWMSMIMNDKLILDENEPQQSVSSDYVYGRRSLRELFFPYPAEGWDDISTEAAVRAIDNFLNTGRPNWREAIAGE